MAEEAGTDVVWASIGTYCLAAAVEFMMSGEDELILKQENQN